MNRSPQKDYSWPRGGSPLMAVTYRVPGAVLTERAHSVPLDHSKPDGERITIFNRDLAAPDGFARPPGFRGDPAHRAAVGLAEAGGRRLPGVAHRPARHRSIDPCRGHP